MSEYNEKISLKLNATSNGHEWEKDGDFVNYFAYSTGYHNGPRCVKCDYTYCHHCNKEGAPDPCLG